MNEIIYSRFIQNNKQLVQDYNKKCKKHVVQNCDEFKKINQPLYHGTTKENSQSILNSGFRIDRFNGTQQQGIGVYTAPDIDTAKTFGEKILVLDATLVKLLNMSTRAHIEFEGLRTEFRKKIKAAIKSQQDEYFTPEEFEQKVESKIDDTCRIMANIEHLPVQEKASDLVINAESAIILANLFDEEITRQKGKSAILSQTRGVYMEPIEQIVVRNLGEIKSVRE